MTPTARTLKFLRAAGLTAAVVEKRLPKCFITVDLFGVIDVVALDPRQAGVLGVQTTSGANHAKRRVKVLESEQARLWVSCGNRLWVMSWTKQGKAGKRKLWTPRIEELFLGHFAEVVA